MSIIVATGKCGRPKGVPQEAKPYCSDTIYEKRLDPAQQKEYIKNKLKVLEDFYITLTAEEDRELRSMDDPLSIDLWVRRLIASRWKED